MPTITDKTYGGQPVSYIYDGSYIKGDKNQNNLLDPGEVWSATFNGPLSGLVADTYFENIACVQDSALPTSSGYIGGDTDTSNNCASAKVYVWWIGYTPGYWKNHLGEWPSPSYTPTTMLTNVFTPMPSTLQKDTFLIALGYKGGTDTIGATQILLRAAVAAVMNEEKFGNDYPPYASTGELIAAVNAALASNDRTKMTTLANTLDKWNNGYHP